MLSRLRISDDLTIIEHTENVMSLLNDTVFSKDQIFLDIQEQEALYEYLKEKFQDKENKS